MQQGKQVVPQDVPSVRKADWTRIKALGLSQPNYVHVACVAKMIPNPIDPIGLPYVPFVAKGDSFDAGRNKAKRARREALKAAA